jgi:hydrogenase expression/formation protein HypC
MCVSVPVRIAEVTPGALPMARLDGGVTCCLAYVPEARVGDFVLVQQGFAVEVLDPESAALSLAAFAELGLVHGEPEAPAAPVPPGAPGAQPPPGLDQAGVASAAARLAARRSWA